MKTGQLMIDGLDLPPAGSSLPPPSAIKWSGGKRRCARVIAAILPPAKCYYEPFLGGASVLYCRNDSQSVASDLYAPLVDFWRLVKDDPQGLVENYEIQWLRLQKDFPGYFYSVRDRFNTAPNGHDLCFLSRTCVNGIIRFNDSGMFNNSFHLSRKGMEPGRFKRAIFQWSERLRSVTLRCCDYSEAVENADKGDLIYMDPPYAGSRQRYIDGLDTKRLLDTLDRLNKRGIRWALSFDGARGKTDYTFPMPRKLYKREINLEMGFSAVTKVLNGASEHVVEKLYLNF